MPPQARSSAEGSGPELLVLLAQPGHGSLRRRLRDSLREAISAGRLAPGTRLPSSRTLAEDLRVSRGVVVDAYAQLTAEGFLISRPGWGTTVADTGGYGRERRAGPQQKAAVDVPTLYEIDLRPGPPDCLRFLAAPGPRPLAMSCERSLIPTSDTPHRGGSTHCASNSPDTWVGCVESQRPLHRCLW
jgi:DNA-binding transcriptional MocR family regulator